ncbi:hypothetical protein Vafri_6229 [Volvox africanus]|uniref:Uncharacterized protein n=1 Tax=Volvox africanus TaxID=51714 RepID=A0A8J4EZ94_9CHLO|nr:hypothetical protein Vafri_6229 [Volvox africanus]
MCAGQHEFGELTAAAAAADEEEDVMAPAAATTVEPSPPPPPPPNSERLMLRGCTAGTSFSEGLNEASSETGGPAPGPGQTAIRPGRAASADAVACSGDTADLGEEGDAAPAA